MHVIFLFNKLRDKQKIKSAPRIGHSSFRARRVVDSIPLET